MDNGGPRLTHPVRPAFCAPVRGHIAPAPPIRKASPGRVPGAASRREARLPCDRTSSRPCSPRRNRSPASGRASRRLLKKALRLPPASPSRARSISSGTCRPASSTAAPSPRSPTPCRARSRRCACACCATRARRAAWARRPTRSRARTTPGRLDLVFFHAERRFIEGQLPVGAERFVSGRVERYGETLQMAHPDYIVAPEARDTSPCSSRSTA